jgi:hypothetical protein
MRRPVLLTLALLCLLALAPSAQATTAGVNVAGIPTPGDLDQAASTGARYVRVFAVRSYFDNGGGNLKASPVNDFRNIVDAATARGMRTVFVLTGAPDGSNTPPSPGDFAAFAHNFAAAMPAGGVAAYEVWNEEDETQFWGGTPNPAQYAAILKAAYPAIKSADPQAKVLLGPLTGNNYDFLSALYDNGAQGSFDAASVHTDTACLVDQPDSFYREEGNVARFTFLGFRTVHDVMAAHGDGDKPIWMTELGWTTTTSTCARGMWAGKKASGVTEAQQAANLREAYHCMSGYPYMEAGMWFTIKDLATGNDELDHYGLARRDNSHKASWDAFHSVATQGDTLSGPCGDFDAPDIKIGQPTANAQYIEALRIQAKATDATQVARMTFQADGKEIRNFTGADVASGKVVKLDWQGAKKLSFGPHTITVIALDPQGNTVTKSVHVTRVRTLPATLQTRIRLGKVKIARGRKASVSGRVMKSASAGLSGKVRVSWQQKRGKKWKTIHAGLKPASKPFTFKQKLKRAGTWRVQLKYANVAPYKTSTATSKTLHVKH